MIVRYALRARGDIASIHDYLAARNPTAATAVVRQIRATCELLGRHPGIGRPTQFDDVRMISVLRYPYIVYHQVSSDAVIILHVRDGRRDVPDDVDLER